MKTNLGVKPLGRGDEVSRVVLLEQARLKSLSLLVREHGPVNSGFKAALYRSLHASLSNRAPYANF